MRGYFDFEWDDPRYFEKGTGYAHFNTDYKQKNKKRNPIGFVWEKKCTSTTGKSRAKNTS